MDIGANIGYFTLIMAKGIKENGKVFSFEPEPKNFELLKKNVEINNYSNVILEKKAIGNKTGIAKLYLADRKNNIFHSGMHRIFRSDLVSQISNPVSINIIKLDDYLQDLKFIKKIRLIKIDVEGAEFDVLKGMSKILDENKGIKIVMEFSSENLEDYGSNPSDVMDFLINKGFKLSIINEVEKRMEEITGIKGIIDSEAKKIGLNIFCSR
jgi:FkbM family methyltransferase